MIKVLFECSVCGCKEGNIITWDRTTEIECLKCKGWETMRDETDSH